MHYASKSCILLCWQRYCTALEHWASAKLCGIEQRAPPIFGRAAITLGIGPRSSYYSVIARRWPNRFEFRYVRPSVRTSTKSFFSDFDLIWCVGRPRPYLRTNLTSIRSNVKVKVTALLKFRKLHFSRCISSAIFAWSSKLVVGGDSIGSGLQLIGVRFSNFLLSKLPREFKLRGMSIFHEIQMAIFQYYMRLQSQGQTCW